MGKGRGSGDGKGQGRGENVTTNIAAGSACAICFTVCMCLIGLPALLVGIILVAVFDEGLLFDLGITILLLSLLFTVGGVVMIIMICTGCCGKYNRATHTTIVHPAPNNTTIMVGGTQHFGGPVGMYGPQPPGYVQHTQGGYPLPNGQSYAGPYGAPMMPQYGEPPPQYGHVPEHSDYGEAPPTYREEATPRQNDPEPYAPPPGYTPVEHQPASMATAPGVENDGTRVESLEQDNHQFTHQEVPYSVAPSSEPPPYSANAS